MVPQGPAVRVASGVYEGADIPPYYDSLFMLLMTAGADRADAIRVMDRALSRNLRVEGVKTTCSAALKYNQASCIYSRRVFYTFYRRTYG